MMNLIVGVLCAVSFSHDHQYVDGTPLTDYHHELWVDGVKKPMSIADLGANRKTEVMWWENIACPPCEQIRMKTVDGDGISSVFSDDACAANPTRPEMCQ